MSKTKLRAQFTNFPRKKKQTNSNNNHNVLISMITIINNNKKNNYKNTSRYPRYKKNRKP